MPKDVMKIGLVQMPVDHDKAKNYNVAKQMVQTCAKLKADIIVLPEMWNTPYNTNLFRQYGELQEGDTWQFLSKLAVEHKCIIVGGSIPEIDQTGKLYNTAYVFDQAGKQIAKHRKWHLFDIDIKGGQCFKESLVLCAGSSATVFSAHGWTIGLGICFDIRFSQQIEIMAGLGCDLLIFPAAFNPTTGPLHWELLFRSRAIDAQAYTVGVAPASLEESSYVSWAHSMVCDPWGNVIADLDQDAKVQVVTLSHEQVSSVRQQIPIGRKLLS